MQGKKNAHINHDPHAAPQLSQHLLAIIALPGTVAILVPALLLGCFPNGLLPSPTHWLIKAAGSGMAVLGLFVIARTISLLAIQGRGTLAPWQPASHLVVSGPYRHIRNPMISGVICLLVGEAGIFTSVPILIWALVFTLINALYIPLVEEPALMERFGQDYRIYKQYVPRWLPRLTPWHPPAKNNA